MYDSNLKPAFMGRCEVAGLIWPSLFASGLDNGVAGSDGRAWVLSSLTSWSASGFEVVSYDFVFVVIGLDGGDADVISHEECVQ